LLSNTKRNRLLECQIGNHPGRAALELNITIKELELKGRVRFTLFNDAIKQSCILDFKISIFH